jgi:hypothetical protein
VDGQGPRDQVRGAVTAVEIMAVILVGALALIALLWAVVRFVPSSLRGEEPVLPDEAGIREDVAKLRADVRELRRSARGTSVFMEMADALKHLSTPTADEATLEVPVMDMALGKVVKLNLPNGKEVAFRLPRKTKSGTKFRFRRGGEAGRDLHLTVRASPETPP